MTKDVDVASKVEFIDVTSDKRSLIIVGGIPRMKRSASGSNLVGESPPETDRDGKDDGQ